MSIFPIIGPRIALSLYQMDLPVHDFIYSTVDGVDVKTPFGTRTSIQAAVDPSNTKRLEEIFGASVSQGDIGIWTFEKLYVVDLYLVGATDRYQSYITYGGTLHKIEQEADWTEQAGMYVYRGSRAVNQQA